MTKQELKLAEIVTQIFEALKTNNISKATKLINLANKLKAETEAAE